MRNSDFAALAVAERSQRRLPVAVMPGWCLSSNLDAISLQKMEGFQWLMPDADVALSH